MIEPRCRKKLHGKAIQTENPSTLDVCFNTCSFEIELCDYGHMLMRTNRETPDAELVELAQANTKVRLLRARLQLREHLTRTLGDPERRLVRAGHGH